MFFESDDYHFIRFPFDRLDDDSLCLCNLWEKQQLAVKLTDDFSAKMIVPRDTDDSSSTVSFWFAKRITLQRRNSRALTKGNIRRI